ncbi:MULTISPECIES: hypothetical protein [Hyphobacterium]|uniref:Uncharacterized protein n=1 Tax=Hyphobacterium vulgare TaxID=1736751 RepID=A0ABV7A029_9PROT
MTKSTNLLISILCAYSALANCAASTSARANDDFLNAILNDPANHDGVIVELSIYPLDVDPESTRPRESYVICWEPCALETFDGSLFSVIRPAVPGAYDGMSGDERVTLTAVFNAVCMQQELACSPHVHFIFEEIPASGDSQQHV